MIRVVSFAALSLAMAMPGMLGGAAWAAPKAAAPTASTPKDSSPWGADYFPNVPLVTQDGKTVRFYEDLLKGKKVMINFIFALCDQGCPLDTANMVRVRKELGERVGQDIFMYSITLDPEHDTPKALKEYTKQYGVGSGWLFLTGKRKDIDAVRDKLGQRGKKEEHANSVQVGDVDKGRWIRVPLTADPKYIAMEATNTLFPGWSAGKQLASIADAPRPEVFGPGQLLFANRCAACHTFGKGNHLGPDLEGIATRRERDWMIRYLSAPDLMRARKDPIALQLAKSNKVLMPNLKLTRKELGELFEYLEAQSAPRLPVEELQAVAESATSGEAPAAAHDHAHHHGGEHK